MENSQTLERIISFQEVLDVLMQHLKTWVLFIFVGLFSGILFVCFKSPVYESTALLQISTSSSASDGLLAKIAGLGGAGGGLAQNGEIQTEQYILTSRTVMENAIQTAHLDIIAEPFYFPIFGHAYANHHTKSDDLTVVHKPLLGFSRYNWGGGDITISQFDVPKNLVGKKFVLKNLGQNQFELVYQGKILLKGTVGTLATGQINQQPINLMISALDANKGAYFTVIKNSLVKAVALLKSQITISLPQMNANLLHISLKGASDQALQNRLAAVIDSGMQLSVQVRVQKARKVLSFLEAQIPQIKDRINKLNQSMDDTMPLGSQFTSMSQEKSIQNLMYTNMLLDVEQYELQKASSLGKIAIITPPTPISSALTLTTPMMLVLSLFMGAVIGAIYIFSRHYILGVVHSAEQVQRVTGLPMLASLQQSSQQVEQRSLFEKGRLNHLQLLSEKDDGDLTLEGFRSFKTNLQLNYFHGKEGCHVIAISGPIPSIGKSFVSANLAQQLSMAGKKVLLIDADIRKGSLWEYFADSRPKEGLVNLLKDRNYDAVIQHTRIPQLQFISTGELHLKHVELLLKDHMKEILEELKPRYDYIVVDTAPVLAVSDALLICRHTDFNFLIFSYGKHNEKDVDVCVKKFEDANIKLHGFVMNMMVAPGLGYYKYGYYKYGYRAYGKN